MTTFVKVIETGSFTRAAEVLGLPKARVSQRIMDLEQNLSIRLIHRTTRALHLTEDGRAYFEKCKEILDDIDELEGTLKGSVRGIAGRVRVEALSSIIRWVIAPQIVEFQEKFPDITVRIGSSDRISNLLEEGIDCAIRGGTLEDSSLVAKHVCDVSWGLYASPGYLRSFGEIRTPQDLVQARRISWFRSKSAANVSWQLFSQRESFELKDTAKLLFDNPDVAISACVTGAGVCPFSPFAVESLVKNGILEPVLPDWYFAKRPIHIVYPTSKHLSASVRSFVDWSFEAMRSSRSLSLTPRSLADALVQSPSREFP